jgi:uncharacterized protein with NRDE domain
MCTATLFRGDGRLLLTFNRDERRERAPEEPPTLARVESTGVNVLAPRDGTAQGTWMAVNSRGVVACLLNGYEEEGTPARSNAVSRGTIIPRVLGAGGFDKVVAAIDTQINLDEHLSFTLLVASLEQAFVLRWRGTGEPEVSRPPQPWAMLTSSSWNTADVVSWRRLAFQEWLAMGAPTDGELPSFHQLRPEGSEGYAPLMRRAETCTRSITQVAVGPGREAEMRYWPPRSVRLHLPVHRTRLALD